MNDVCSTKVLINRDKRLFCGMGKRKNEFRKEKNGFRKRFFGIKFHFFWCCMLADMNKCTIFARQSLCDVDENNFLQKKITKMKKTLLALALLLGTSGVFAQIGIKTDALNTQKKANLKAEVSQRIKSQKKAALNMSKDDTRELICDFSDQSLYTFGKTASNQISDDIWKKTDTTSGFGMGAPIDQFLGITGYGWFIFWPAWAGENTYYNLSAANGFAYVDMLALYNENLNNFNLGGYIMFTAPLETYGKRGVDLYFNQVLQRFNQERYFIDWSNDPNFTTYDSIEFNVRGVEMNANVFDYGVKKVTLPNGTLNANAVGATPDQLTYVRVRLYSPATPAQPHGYFWIVDDFYWSESPENRVDLVAKEYYGGGYHLIPQGIVPDTLVYNVTLENTGATDYNDIVLTTELYSVAVAEEEGQPDVYTMVEGWGNYSEPDTVANTTYTGIYSTDGSDTVWTAMRTRDMRAYSTSLPSLNVGTYALASKLTSAETDFTQFLDDTTYFNVVGPMVVPEGHYQWAKDRNVLVERRDFRYGFVEEGGNVYLTDEAAYTSEGYEVCVAFSASATPNADKYINGVEVVPSLDSCAPGVVIQGKLRKFDYNAESWDAVIVDVEDEFGNPVESAPYTVQQSDLNNGLCTDPDYLDVITSDQFHTIYMPFPYGVKIEADETYYACYRLLTTGKFSVGTDDPQLNTFGPGAMNQTALLVFTPGLSESASYAWGGMIYASSYCDYRTPLIRLLVSETAGVKDDVAELTSSLNAYPNPASNNATISYTLNKSGNVRIVVTDIMGREVMNMNQGSQVAGGTYTVNMNTANLSNGTYFYTLSVNGERQTKKLVINK